MLSKCHHLLRCKNMLAIPAMVRVRLSAVPKHTLLSVSAVMPQQQALSRSALAVSDLSGLHLPSDAVFQEPWVKANIAVTYGHQVQDGIGSQTLRMLAVYGLASSLGIGHVFRPLGCVGHIGSHVHYREAACNHTSEADRRQLSKAQRMIQLPTTAQGNTSHWHSKFLPALDWTPFVRDVTDALRQRRPTLYEIERVNQLVRYYPDIFQSIPALRPASPPVSCAAGTAQLGSSITGPDVLPC